MAVPAIYSLCRNYPELQVVFVTRPRLTQIFVNPPANLTLVGADVDVEYKGFWGLRRLAKHLVEKYGVSDYVDLHNVLRTRILGIWLRLKQVAVTTLIKDRVGRRALTRSIDKVFMPLMSSRARYREAMANAGFAVTLDFESIFGTCGSKAPAEMFAPLSEAKSAGENWIGIAPFAAHEGKVYPTDLMEQVIDRLLESKIAKAKASIDEANGNKLRIFLFGGGKKEQEVFERWQAKHPQTVVSLADKRAGFAAEMALMSHLDVMLTMDSANMHLAALAGTKVLSIWGATHAYAGFGGWKQSEEQRIEVTLACRPCSVFGNKACLRGDMMCMRSISPETVAKRVIAALGK